MSAGASAPERAFQEHLGRPDFLIGVARGRWRHLRTAWPAADFSITARDGLEWGFHFQLDRYPGELPTACPCNVATGTPLPGPLWPKGTGRVAAVFAPHWNPSALYLPCDRAALPGHHHWINIHPELLWRPAKGVVHYLEIVHELLSSSSYCSPVRQAS